MENHVQIICLICFPKLVFIVIYNSSHINQLNIAEDIHN